MTEWQGERLTDGQSLVVRFDAPDPLDERAHGFGDAFMAARYIRPLLQWAGTQQNQIVLVVPAALRHIFMQNFWGPDFVDVAPEASTWSIKALDRWGYGMWHVCKERLRLAEYSRYLVADMPQRFDQNYLHVGLCLHGGNDAHKQWWDEKRSIHDSKIAAPIFSVPGVVWHWLEVANPAPFQAVDHRSELRSWMDTANLIAGLDLIITVDTAVAHLAGALGRPVWLMLRPPLPTGTRMTPEVTRDATYGDQRWNPIELCDGIVRPAPRAPLYATQRLFYQDTPGDWPSVIAAVKAALLKELA